MKKVAGLLFVGMWVLLGGRADAQVISFNELSPTAFVTLGTISCTTSGGSGFRFLSDHFHLIGTHPAFGTTFAQNGTPHLGYEANRGYPITMERLGGGTFSLLSVDGGEFYSSDNARPDAETLVVTGYLQGGGTVEHSFPVDLIRDGAGGVDDFQHYVLPATFTNLVAVRFAGRSAGNLDGGISIDNLEYQAHAPATLNPCVVTPLPPETPVVTITNPSAGNVVGTVLTQATATDDVGVTSVQFKIDGVNAGPALTSAPYTFAWDTTALVNGPYTITVEARDAADNVGTASIVVTVANNTGGGINPHYVELDGTNDYFQTSDHNVLSFGTGSADLSFTFELWFKPHQMIGQQLIGKWANGAAKEYRVYTTAGVLRVDLRDASATVTVSAYTGNLNALVGAWHHVAVTYDGRGGATAANGITVYVDGLSRALSRINNASYVAMENTIAPLKIGHEGTQWMQFRGGLDDIRIWNTVRTLSELQASMTTELTGVEAGLAVYWPLNEGTGTVASDRGTSNLPVTLFEGPVWVAGGVFSPPVPDTTAPDITNIQTSNLTPTGATITFNTSEPASGWITYSVGASCPCTDASSGGMTTSHTVTLTSLTPSTTYQFVVKATDPASNLQTTDPMTFATLAPPPDTTAPTVTMVRPGGGTVVGTVILEASATDNVGVTSVQFKVDGVDVGSPDTTAPYSISWDSTTVPDGTHTIAAEARDAANLVGSASVIVTVNQTPPPVTPYFLGFDGTDDYLQVPDHNALTFGNGAADTPLTFEMWVRPDLLTRGTLLNKWGGANAEYKFYLTANVIRLDLRDQSANVTVSAYTTSQAALAGAWHHIAAVYDGRGGATAANGITIYVDGVAVGMTRINNASYVAMENTSSALQIGREGPQWMQFDGSLDDVRLWNVARTAAEIQTSRSFELTGSELGLVGYFKFNEGSGTTAGDASLSSLTATLFSGAAWMSGGPLAPVVPDTTPPTISNLFVSNLGATGATITFTTSEPASGWITYSVGASCPCTDVFSASPGTAHTVTLSSLTPSTTYQFVVKATDPASNLQTTDPMTFATLAPPPDTTAPTVTMVRPGGGTVVGTVILEASATDNVGVTSVQFKVDGVDVGSPDTTAPYSISWDSTTVPDGTHTIAAEARDAANLVGSASVIVTVNQTPPPVTPYFLGFDGTDDYLQVPDHNALTFGNGAADTPLTFEMWVRPDLLTRGTLLNKWGGANAEYKFYLTANVIRLDLRDQSANVTVSAYTTSQAALAGAWHHIAAVYDGRGGATAANGITIYVDGVAVGMTRINNASYVAMENTSSALQIGREGPQWMQFDGSLDDVRLWNVARTAAEIQTSRSFELTGSELGLVGYFKFNEGSGTTAGDASLSSLTATLFSGPLWTYGGPLAPVVPDTTPPTISNLFVSNLGATGATITFNTSEPASGWITYSVGASCPCTDASSGGMSTSHTVTLTSLTPSTTYQFVVKATDPASNLQTTDPMTFATLAPPPDTTAPTVTMVRPGGGTVVGTVILEASATDNVGVTSVQFKVDGVDLGAADATAPYTMSWDTTTVADGPHTITAEARDAANNVGTASAVVTVSQTSIPHYIDLDGVDDYLQAPDAPGLSFGSGGADTPLTVETWFRPDSMTRHQLLGKWGGASSEYRLHIVSGIIRLDLRDSSAQTTVSAFTTNSYVSLIGSWHHLAVTYDGRGGATAAEGITIYIDGLAVPVVRLNNAAYVAMENLTAPLQIGREGPSWNQYNGALDELRLWNVARSATEIQAAMTTELSGGEAGLVAYWKFNEGAGATVTDDSPADHTATLSNGPAWRPGGPPILD